MSLPRPDTRLLVTAPVTTDLGQYSTNLTSSGAGAYELTSARTALGGTGAGRAIEIAAECNNAHDAYLLRHSGDAGAPKYGVHLTAGTIRFYDSATTLLVALALPNVGATATGYLIHWSTAPNPATTGAGDAQRSVFSVYDLENDVLAWTVVAHVATTPDATGAVSIGGQWDGATLNNPYTLGITTVRISARAHTRTEFREHLFVQTAAPTITGVTAAEGPVLPADLVLAKSLTGPQYQAAAVAMSSGRNRHRMASPLVQAQVSEFPTYEDDARDSVVPTWVRDLEDGYQAQLTLCWRYRIPRQFSKLRMRTQWSTWDTDASGVPDVVDLRLHSSDKRPAALAASTSITAIARSTDDSPGGFLGALADLPLVNIERDADGWTWIYLSSRTDAGSGAGNVAYSIRMISIIPVAAAQLVPNPWNP